MIKSHIIKLHYCYFRQIIYSMKLHLIAYSDEIAHSGLGVRFHRNMQVEDIL